MYHVSTHGVDECMINVHCYYYYEYNQSVIKRGKFSSSTAQISEEKEHH